MRKFRFTKPFLMSVLLLLALTACQQGSNQKSQSDDAMAEHKATWINEEILIQLRDIREELKALQAKASSP